MAAVCGKWQLITSDSNFGNYMDAVGVSAEHKKMALAGLTEASKLFQNIVRNGDTWIVTIISPAGEKTDTYVEGKPTDTTTLDGRPISVVYTVEGEDLVEAQSGSGFTSRNVRHVDGDKMTMVFTANGSVTCSRVYQKCS